MPEHFNFDWLDDPVFTEPYLEVLRDKLKSFFSDYHKVNLRVLLRIISDYSRIENPDFSFDILVKFERINK